MPLINTETEFLLFFTQKIESSSYALSLKNTTLSFSASCHLVLVYFFGTEPVPRKPMHQVRVIQNKHRVPNALLNNMGHIQRHLFEENNAIQCRVRLHKALLEGPACSLLSMASYAFFVRSTLRLEVSRDGFTFSPGRGTSSAFLPAVSMIRSALEFRTGTVRRRTAQSTLHGTPYLGGGNEATLETTPHANIIILYNTTFTPHEYNNYTPIPQHCTGVSNSPNAPVFKSISP
jgi:hypothetical protein